MTVVTKQLNPLTRTLISDGPCVFTGNNITNKVYFTDESGEDILSSYCNKPVLLVHPGKIYARTAKLDSVCSIGSIVGGSGSASSPKKDRSISRGYVGSGWWKDPISGTVCCRGVPEGETHTFDGDPINYISVHDRRNLEKYKDRAAVSNVPPYELMETANFRREVTYGEYYNNPDASNAEDIRYAAGKFVGMYIGHWDIAHCTHLYETFEWSNLEGMGVENWDYSTVTQYYSTFAHCLNIPDLSQSGIGSGEVAYWYEVFEGVEVNFDLSGVFLDHLPTGSESLLRYVDTPLGSRYVATHSYPTLQDRKNITELQRYKVMYFEEIYGVSYPDPDYPIEWWPSVSDPYNKGGVPSNGEDEPGYNYNYLDTDENDKPIKGRKYHEDYYYLSKEEREMFTVEELYDFYAEGEIPEIFR